MQVALIVSNLEAAALAAALRADVVGIAADAALPLPRNAAVWGAITARIGARAYALHLTGRQSLTAAESVGWGIADLLVPAGADPLKWRGQWVAGRSGLALEVGAELIRHRGGDPLERAAFARLFAAGEPQQGLSAFLGKRKPIWRGTMNDER